MHKALPGGRALCRKRRKKEEVQMVMGEEPFGQASCSGCLLSVYLVVILAEVKADGRQISYRKSVK